MKSVAILAAYNLETSIKEIIERTKNYVDFVIVVSDGSYDQTYNRALEAGALCPKHTPTRGKGFAVRKGIQFRKKFNSEIVVLMDDDGKHIHEEINRN